MEAKRRRMVILGLVLAVICIAGFILYLVWTMGLLEPWIDDVFYQDTSALLEHRSGDLWLVFLRG